MNTPYELEDEQAIVRAVGGRGDERGQVGLRDAVARDEVALARPLLDAWLAPVRPVDDLDVQNGNCTSKPKHQGPQSVAVWLGQREKDEGEAAAEGEGREKGARKGSAPCRAQARPRGS